MATLFRHMTRAAYCLALSAVALTLLAGAPCALAQSAAPAPSQDKASATNPGDGKVAAQTPNSRINSAEVAKRVDQELGIDLQATTADWQRQLDLLEKELSHPRLRYSELNEFRDRLQRVRSEAADLWNKLQPRLQAHKRRWIRLILLRPRVSPPSRSKPRSPAPNSIIIQACCPEDKQQSIRPICGSRTC